MPRTYSKDRYPKGYADRELSPAAKSTIIALTVSAVVIVLAFLVWAVTGDMTTNAGSTVRVFNGDPVRRP
jgi:hypothetical protein